MRGITINQSNHIRQQTTRPVQPRAIGAATLSVQPDNSGRTQIVDLRQSGSTKLAFPTSRRKDIEAILVNTAGGITGGDNLTLDVTVKSGASLTMTTQACERAYRAQQGETGNVTATLAVQSGAQLNWLPQELILFDRCALHRRLEINLEPGAGLLMAEPVVFGRTAMNEDLCSVYFQDRIKIIRDGRILYVDGIQLHGDAAKHLARPAVASGAGAMASVVLVRPDAEILLREVRNALPASAGASLIAPDVMVIRHLALDSFELRRDLMPILELLSQTTLPTSWRL